MKVLAIMVLGLAALTAGGLVAVVWPDIRYRWRLRGRLREDYRPVDRERARRMRVRPPHHRQ